MIWNALCLKPSHGFFNAAKIRGLVLQHSIKVLERAPKFWVGEVPPQKRDGEEPGIPHAWVPSHLAFIVRHITCVMVCLDGAPGDLSGDAIERSLPRAAQDFTTGT